MKKTQEEREEEAKYETADKLINYLVLDSRSMDGKVGSYIERMKKKFPNIKDLKAKHFNRLRSANFNYFKKK